MKIKLFLGPAKNKATKRNLFYEYKNKIFYLEKN